MLQESEALEKVGGGQGENKDDEEEEGSDNENGGGLKIALVSKDGTKPVNGGLEIYNKMDIKFMIQRKIQEWAMACADEIKQEVANRGRLRQEAISLA